MKKTVTINLAGIGFHIDEDAYGQLRDYLQSIKDHFSDADEQDEIITDIELRITELLREKEIKIISVQDVEFVISVLGTAEDFGAGLDLEDASKKRRTRGIKSVFKKRVFRNPDERIIAGVAGGLGSYFDIDPLWFRLVFVVTTFFGGAGILIYLVFWLIVPRALSTADKLKMKGEPITAESIGKTIIVQKMDEVKSSIGPVESKVVSFLKDISSYLVGWLKKSLKFLVSIFRRLIGATVLILGALFTLVFAIGFFNVIGNPDFFNIGYKPELDYLIDSLVVSIPGGRFWLILGLTLLLMIPIIQVIYLALRLLFRLDPQPKPLKAFWTVSWIFGLILLGTLAAFNFSQFSTQGYRERKVVLEEVHTDTLYITLKEDFDRPRHTDGTHWIYDEESDELYLSSVRLGVEASEDDNYYLLVKHKARGRSHKKAIAYASNIGYNYLPGKDRIQFNSFIRIKDGDPYRFQETHLTVLVPEGKSVYLDKSIKYFIHDIYNITHTYDRRMINHTWEMTPEGLACTDCE